MAADAARVAELLGRPPRGPFEVVARTAAGEPAVIRNAPFLDDGTPMPTRYWLVDPRLRRAVDRLESAGGVRAAEAAVAPDAVADAHRRYAAERDAAIPPGWAGPRPSGGVGGTRRGVKCLHAHLAWHLAGGDDPVGRWVAGTLHLDGPPVGSEDAASQPGAPQAVTAVAAVDCGTNSTRLLVADGDGRPLERLMTITRLGEGVDATHALAEPAIDRTVAVLRRYRDVMDRFGVGPVRMTATSAARDASNRERFFAAAREAVGVDAELISGGEEAALSFAGATAELDVATAPWLVADIGGGSTELARGPEGRDGDARLRPTTSRSIDVGCVRVTERFLRHDPPLPGELDAAKAYVEGLLEATTAELPDLRAAGTLVGLAGTVSATARLDLRLETYDRRALHHHRLKAVAVAGLLAEMATLSVDARRRRPGMEEERADVIVGGLVVLDALLRHFRLGECLASESDILDGLVMTLLAGGR